MSSDAFFRTELSRLFSVKCHFGGNELVYGEEACRNWSAESTTVSRFIHLSLLLRIAIASLIRLVLRSDSCPITFTRSQSITWFSLVAWSVMADLFCCSSADFLLCLVNRKPAHFHRNDTSRRIVDSLSVLKKASDDVKRQLLTIKVRKCS